jgi:uncharacterized membrane protein
MYSLQTVPPTLPIRSSDLAKLPRKLMAGVITVVMGLVVIVIGIVIFGSTTGIAAYIDNIFADLGVKANITQTIQSFNISTTLAVLGIVVIIIGFALIVWALIEVGSSAQRIWRGGE